MIERPNGNWICIDTPNDIITSEITDAVAIDRYVPPSIIATGKDLYALVKNGYQGDNSRGVNYSGIIGTLFYGNTQSSKEEFKGYIPQSYKDSNLRLIPKKYIKVPDKGFITVKNAPCCGMQVLYYQGRKTPPDSICHEPTVAYYGEARDSFTMSHGGQAFTLIERPAPGSGIYDYFPRVQNQDNNEYQTISSTGGSGSVGVRYYHYDKADPALNILVRPSVRYSIDLAGYSENQLQVDKSDTSVVFSKGSNDAAISPLGIASPNKLAYYRYKSKYGDNYKQQLWPNWPSTPPSITGIGIYNNFSSIGDAAFIAAPNLKEVLISEYSDDLEANYGITCGLTSIGNYAFKGATQLATIYTVPFDGTSTYSWSLPSSVSSLGEAAFHSTGLHKLNLYNTNITYIPKDCFTNTKFMSLKFVNSEPNEIDEGDIILGSNTKLEESSFRKNSLLTIVDGLNSDIQDATFAGCINLNTTQNSSTQISKIGNGGFLGCPLTNSDLFSVIHNVSSIGVGAFYNSKISGSIKMNVVTSVGRFAFANKNMEGAIKEFSFKNGSSGNKLDNFCFYGQKNLAKLGSLINCDLSTYALDGSSVVQLQDPDYTGAKYSITTNTRVSDQIASKYSGNGYNDRILTTSFDAGWFYDAFSKNSYGIRKNELPIGVYVGDGDYYCIFYKFHPLGGGRAKTHSGLQDYYIQPNTLRIHKVTHYQIPIPDPEIDENDFVIVNSNSANIFSGIQDHWKGYYSDYSNYMFNTVSAELCTKLTTIVDYAFEGLDHKSFVFPKDPTLEYLGKGTFYKCSNLESVINLEKQTRLKVIQRSTFNGCDLERVDLPNTIQTIGSYAFNGNSNLSNVTFNGASTSSALKKIESYAFYGTRLDKNMNRSGLTTINNIISNCTYIGDSAFAEVLSPSNTTAAYTAGTVTIPKCCTYLGLYAFAPVLGATQFTLNFTNFDSTALSNLEFWAIRPGEDTGKVWIKVTDKDCANIMEKKVKAQRVYGYHRFPVEINYSNDQGSIKIPAKLSPGS